MAAGLSKQSDDHLFRRRDKGDGQEGVSKLHIPILLGRCTQGSSAPGILHSAVTERPAKRATAVSSVIRHRYNYKDGSNVKDGDYEFIASSLADNDDEDLRDVEVVEKAKPKSQRRRVGTARGRGSATPASSAKRTSVRSANKYQSHLSTTLASSTKRTSVSSVNKQQSKISITLSRSTKSTSVRSANKQKIQILFISTRKARTKHTVSFSISFAIIMINNELFPLMLSHTCFR